MIDANSENTRICDTCGKVMTEGYVINGGESHHCSKECLTAKMPYEEYLELYDDGNGDSYYTEF